MQGGRNAEQSMRDKEVGSEREEKVEEKRRKWGKRRKREGSAHPA